MFSYFWTPNTFFTSHLYPLKPFPRTPLHSLSTPRVNFVNVLRAAFACTDPESEKKTDGLTVFFVLFESSHVKASSKMLVKLTQDVQNPSSLLLQRTTVWDTFFGLCMFAFSHHQSLCTHTLFSSSLSLPFSNSHSHTHTHTHKRDVKREEEMAHNSWSRSNETFHLAFVSSVQWQDNKSRETNTVKWKAN